MLGEPLRHGDCTLVAFAARPCLRLAHELSQLAEHDRRIGARLLERIDALEPGQDGARFLHRNDATGGDVPACAQLRNTFLAIYGCSMQIRRSSAVVIAAAAAVLLAALSASAAAPAQPTLTQLVGQHLLVRMHGTTPSAAFLGRVRRGEIGGVVLFQDNGTAAQLPGLIGMLQSAARAGGQLPLLIATDQEGGIVKRLPGPPTLAPGSMTTAAIAHAQGLATGRYLRGLSINTDLAPVLDVPASPSAFITPRAFASSAELVADRGVAFAQGVDAAGVAATVKHFPGLGRVHESTDDAPAAVTASAAALRRDLLPFKRAIAAHVPALMVGTASYPAYGDNMPAACSPGVVTKLLRQMLHYGGVTLSDDLDTPGVARRIPPVEATVQAVKVGVDMVYIAGVGGSGGDAIGKEAYAALLRAAKDGTLPAATLHDSYARIAALKKRY
jgi:beta-N-acetylhexosaminidase